MDDLPSSAYDFEFRISTDCEFSAMPNDLMLQDGNERGVSDIRLYRDDELSKILTRVIRPAGVTSADAPIEKGHVLFFGPDSGDFACGVWRCEAGVIDIDSYPVYEFCWLVLGDVLLQDFNGESLHLTPGSAVLIPKGFRGSWTTRDRCQKFFACHGNRESVMALCGDVQQGQQ